MLNELWVIPIKQNDDPRSIISQNRPHKPKAFLPWRAVQTHAISCSQINIAVVQCGCGGCFVELTQIGIGPLGGHYFLIADGINGGGFCRSHRGRKKKCERSCTHSSSEDWVLSPKRKRKLLIMLPKRPVLRPLEVCCVTDVTGFASMG